MKCRFGKYIMFFGLFLMFQQLNAQGYGQCGTKSSNNYQDVVKLYASTKVAQPAKNTASRVRAMNQTPTCIDKTISLVFHVVRDSFDATKLICDTSLISKKIDSLNKMFAPICLKFKSCSTNLINNSDFDTVNNSKLKQMRLLYNVNNILNIYIVKKIDTQEPCDAFTYYPGEGYDNIYITKEKFEASDYMLLHQLGHYFGLLHTCENIAGVTGTDELVMGSDCKTTGDYLCDTPADPNVGSPNSGCEILTAGKDKANEYYLPPTNNIMSTYESCGKIFTPQQYQLMADTYLKYRSSLW